MINPRKKQEILRSAMVGSALISLVFAVVACNNGAPEGASSTGGADAKMAADKIAEAEPFYEGREDLTKARTAVTILRQAHAAD
jgi:predicted lipid-binding transport protein (Tim44 family)